MDKDGNVAPEQPGYLAEEPDETGRFNPWQNLLECIGEEDLDDRTKWSEPINADPMAYFLQALNR